MELAEYHALDNDKKTEILNRDASFLAQRITGKSICFLYQLYSFYVEVYFYNKVENYHCFENVDYLNPYLEDVDITSIEMLL